jgi:PAS domain S-box-containing protein
MAQQESEAGYRELFLANPQPMWVCHRETQKFLEVNEAALRLYGYRRHEFLELSLPHLFVAGELLGQAGAPLPERSRQLKKDRSEIEVELTWQDCRFQGAAAYLVLVRQGGVRREALEAELERQVAEQSSQTEAARRELETFSYSISHDLQAPLRHITGFSQALLDDHARTLEPEAQEYLTRIAQAAGKMSQLIEAIQQLSRVARSELDRQPVNLSVAAQVIALELKHGAPQRRVDFLIEEGVSASADPRLTRQLLEILIGNAWKFSSRKPAASIEFGARQLEGETVYFVKDNGVGFEMAYADKLFSIFHRLHRAEEFEGTGVGLAIAHRIVERHGGRIWAESAPERGATFYFTL